MLVQRSMDGEWWGMNNGDHTRSRLFQLPRPDVEVNADQSEDTNCYHTGASNLLKMKKPKGPKIHTIVYITY